MEPRLALKNCTIICFDTWQKFRVASSFGDRRCLFMVTYMQKV